MVVTVGMRVVPVAAEAGVNLQQSEVHRVFSRGSWLWIMGPWQWCVAQAPGRLWIVTCACTQDPWWTWRQR